MAVFRRKTAEMSPYEKKEAVKTERGAADVARMLGLPEPKRKGPKWMS